MHVKDWKLKFNNNLFYENNMNGFAIITKKLFAENKLIKLNFIKIMH